MNNKGQAALEYLMTYGWALIVIAIVVGVLVFIVSSPAGVVCNSSDPAKIVVKASNLEANVATGTDMGKIILTNLTGGDISSVYISSSGAIATTDQAYNASVSSGDTIEVTATSAAVETYSTSNLMVGYTDFAALDRNVTITCSGPITVTT